jgi:plasmid maintenance system antidote protein VapI
MIMSSINLADLLSTTDAAAIIGVSPRRVNKLCQDGRLGVRIGNQYFITKQEAKKFKANPPGRPKKAS